MSWLGFLKYLGDVREYFPGHLGSCFSYIELAGIHADFQEARIWLAALMSGKKNPGHQSSKP